MTDKDVLTEKDLLGKVVAIKRFEYFSLGKAFEKQTNVIKKQRLLIRRKNKPLKAIIGTDETYHDKVSNALLYLPKEQVENMWTLTKE